MAEAAGNPIADTSVLSNPAALQQWSNLIDSLFGKSQQTNSSSQTGELTTTQNSSGADPALMQMITQLQGRMSAGAGDPQIQALLGPIFEQFKNSALPGVQGLANAGGGVYNSTTQKLLANDALAKATAQGGTVLVNQQNNLQTQLAALLAILARSTATSQTARNSATQGTSNTQSSGSAGNAAKAALGAAAAAQAAKAIKALTNPSKGEGRSDSTDDTSGMPKWTDPEEDHGSPGEVPGNTTDPQLASSSEYSTDSDPAAFYGTEDSGANGVSDPNAGNDSFDFLTNIFGTDAGNTTDDSGGFGNSGGDPFGDSSGEDFGESF